MIAKKNKQQHTIKKKDFDRMKEEIITSIDLAWMYREARDQIRNFKNSQKNRYDEYDIGN